MGLKDVVKRSLGFDEEDDNSEFNTTSVVADIAHSVSGAVSNGFNKMTSPREEPEPVNNYDDEFYRNYERYNAQYRGDFTIVPDQSLYELILIRPKSLDDINYIVDQVLDRNNPVIVDLSFLERESPSNFKLAGEKVKEMRMKYGVESFLISRCEGRNMIIIVPHVIKVIKKD